MQGGARTSLVWIGLLAFTGCEEGSPCDQVEAGGRAPRVLDSGDEVLCVDVMVDGNGCDTSRIEGILERDVCYDTEGLDYGRVCTYEERGACCYLFEDVSWSCPG